ncbi:hypothetical protein GCM10027055_03670 [Janibacter alkaliphilus]|uniref:LCP family protein required for cell wall assembly n=1 Tax=Janibacter alkaliphilus TaxID=1069963 RepID=A0A852X0Y8_9MICO|nr:LCP family protein required for cell wall assembly [Janibacter alkaliphilus]
MTPHRRRPARTRPRLVTGVAAASALALLAGCSAGDEGSGASSGSGSSSGTTSSGASSASPSSPVATTDIGDAPEPLVEAVARRYGGEDVEGSTHLGRWRGQRVAVVTAEQDVTLAIESTTRRSWKVVGGWWPSLGETEGAEDLGGRRHVLVLGSDAREGQDPTRTRADAIQLLGLDGDGGAGLMGFARDLWVPIPGHGTGKLNSALTLGGPDAEVGAVEDVSGIDVDGYVLTGFEGFESIVDELGGLSFVAPFDMDSDLAGGKISAGRHTLDGGEALAWARERKSLPGGDLDRSGNQGLLLAAAAVQARAEGPARLPRALSILDEHTESDLSAEEMLLFSASFYRVSPTRVGREVAGGSPATRSGQSVILLDDDARSGFADFRDGRIGG